MNFILLELYIILLLGHISEHSSTVVNDVCVKSGAERLSIKYIFKSSIPKGGLKYLNHTRFNNTDEASCYTKCCENTRCNIAWHTGMICITFECDLKKFENCRPVKVDREKLRLSKFFLLRSPVKLTTTSGGEKTKRNQNSITISTVWPKWPKTTVTLIPTTTTLKVVISNNQTLTLPINYVTLVANVLDDKNLTYEYLWSILSKPPDKNSGKLDTSKTKELKLTDLIVGDYQFQVEVRGNNSYGKANVFVFVKPAKKRNEPPVAKILPMDQTVQLPNNVILDGSMSTDDDKIVFYNWELIKGPLETDKKMKNDQSMLNLEHLIAGNYTFKLTVKDITGAASSVMANVTVLAEKDYPPTAEPGNNVIVELPLKYVILNGSASRDDKKIVSYQWTKKSDGLTADIQGVREPVLNLTNLQEGTYTFNLKVTDSSGQSSDKDIQVFVKPRTNSPPIAKVSITNDNSMTVRLPATEAVLNGSLSSDDEKIVRYEWQQIEGQPKLNLVDADKPIAYVYDLKIGLFKFKLTVFDKEKLSGSEVLTLRINESKNQKPKARIQKIPRYYHFETNLFKLDGSNSWDDVSIVQYKWTREDDSLAVGQVLEDSDSSSVLLLTDLLPGSYKFKLQVFDIEHFSDTIIPTLEIHKSKYELNLVELQFRCSLHLFTESKKNAFLKSIELIIQKKIDSDSSKVVIHLVQLDKLTFTNSVNIVFYVTLNKETQSTTTKVISPTSTANKSASLPVHVQKKSPETSASQIVVEERFVEALQVVDVLNLVRHNSMSMEYQVIRVETYVCQNNCSSHGTCNEVTKLCECETFWTSSYIRDRFGDGRPNCDWSIIYLSIFFGILGLIFVGICWFLLWIRHRRCKSKKSLKIRKHKYMKLGDYDYESRVNSKVPKSLTNGIKSRINSEKANDSLLNSDSTLSSEEETTNFINTNNRSDHSSIKKSSSFLSMSTNNGDTLKTS